MIRQHSRLRHRAGFTLIEVMVAVGLTSIMLWGLLQLFTSATRFSSAVTNETELCAAGRAALERMVREIGSAAPPDVSYLNIVKSAPFDTIRFVAPVADGGNTMAHVKYHVVTQGGRKILHRAVEAGSGLSGAPATYDDDASFGLEVEALSIKHITSGGNVSSGGVSVSGSGAISPRAVLIELRLRDRKGLARITLSSGAILPGGGL